MIIATGHPEKGLGKHFSEHFEVLLCSRSSGYDFNKSEDIDRFCDLSLKYRVFINSSKLKNFRQVELLKRVYQTWSEKQHSGHIINIGSSSFLDLKATPRTYYLEKEALRKYSLMLARHSMSDSGRPGGKIRVTHLAPGWIRLPETEERAADQPQIDPKDFCQTLGWVIQSPESINMNEIVFEATPLNS